MEVMLRDEAELTPQSREERMKETRKTSVRSMGANLGPRTVK
jgi:hypothetical protein